MTKIASIILGLFMLIQGITLDRNADAFVRKADQRWEARGIETIYLNEFYEIDHVTVRYRNGGKRKDIHPDVDEYFEKEMLPQDILKGLEKISEDYYKADVFIVTFK